MWELRLVSNTVGAIDQITARRQEACRLGRKQGKQNVTVLNKNYACRHCTAHVQVSTYFLSSSGFYKCVCYLIIYVFWKVAEMERTDLFCRPADQACACLNFERHVLGPLFAEHTAILIRNYVCSKVEIR